MSEKINSKKNLEDEKSKQYFNNETQNREPLKHRHVPVPELSFMEKLKEFGDRSTFHGIPNFVSTERIFIKITWLVCILMSGSYCMYTIGKNTSDYLSYQVETVIEIKNDNDADFPSVTFCNNLICDLPEYSFNDSLYAYFNKSGKLEKNEIDKNISQTSLKLLNQYAEEAYLDKLKSSNQLEKLFQNRSDLKKMLISCQYNNEFCYENNFEFYQLGEFKKCYKFNSRVKINGSETPIRKARRYGKTYGFQLELFVGIPSFCKSPFSSTEGVVLYVHNNTYDVTPDFNGIELSPGAETNIAIDRTLIAKKSDPYSKCIEDKVKPSETNEDIDLTFKMYGFYSQPTCLQLCYQKFIVDNYNCYDSFLPKISNVISCPKIVESFNNSIYSNKFLYYQDPKNDLKCTTNCREQCEYMIYDTTVSNALFPTTTYSEILTKNENISGNYEDPPYNIDLEELGAYERVKQSVLAVNVFYKSDFYTRIKEKPSIEPEVFISNIGGAFGLFLGISLLSLIEIFEILFEAIYILFTGPTTKNKVTTFHSK